MSQLTLVDDENKEETENQRMINPSGSQHYKVNNSHVVNY